MYPLRRSSSDKMYEAFVSSLTFPFKSLHLQVAQPPTLQLYGKATPLRSAAVRIVSFGSTLIDLPLIVAVTGLLRERSENIVSGCKSADGVSFLVADVLRNLWMRVTL